MTDEAGGRIIFSSTGRSLVEEDEIVILSVGVDIGSSTSHLVFSRIVLERLDSRYVVCDARDILQSDILLTPYTAPPTRLMHRRWAPSSSASTQEANVDPDEIDTGALILTGVAVRRRNARNIGDLFARQAGKMVAVSAGDSLETVMAAHGSGAVARSIRDKATVMNIDVGGGTSKIAICCDGRVSDVTALDVAPALSASMRKAASSASKRLAAVSASSWGSISKSGDELAPEGERALAALDGGSAVRGDGRRRSNERRQRPPAPRSAQRLHQDRPGDLFRRRRGIHLRS